MSKKVLVLDPGSHNPRLGLPDVLFVEDLAAVLRCSPSTIRRRLKAGVLCIPTLPGVDKRPRFGRPAVVDFLGRGRRANR